MAIPTKSVVACARVAGLLASFHSGEPAPNTRVMSPDGAVELFSSSILAAETPPTLQPAWVNVSQGAATVCWFSSIMFGSGSSAPSTVSVQYLNEDEKVGMPLF